MAKTAVASNSVTISKLRLSESLYDFYSERAAKFGRTIEEEIVTRLNATREYNAASPIYLDDAARAELTNLTGKLVRNADDLLAWARQVTALKVEQVEVPLGQTLTTRLSTRTFGTPWADYIRNLVIRCLEQEVGLR